MLFGLLNACVDHKGDEVPAALADGATVACCDVVDGTYVTIGVNGPAVPDPGRECRYAGACNATIIECRQPGQACIISTAISIAINGGKDGVFYGRLRPPTE